MKSLLLFLVLASGSVFAQWAETKSTDAMTGKVITTATIKSSNSLNLAFPYQGNNFAELVIRQHPTSGLNVMVTIEKGQILCRSYRNCTIQARFDDKPAVNFPGAEPADNSSDAVFLRNEGKFVNSAKSAKKILVQLNLYQGGSQVLEFNAQSPLAWNSIVQAPPKKPSQK